MLWRLPSTVWFCNGKQAGWALKVCQKLWCLGGKWDYTSPKGRCKTIFPTICCSVSAVLLDAGQKEDDKWKLFLATKQKIRNSKQTSSHKQLGFLLNLNHTWQQLLENAHIELTKNAKRDRMKNASVTRRWHFFRRQLVSLRVLPHKAEAPWGQRLSLNSVF